MSARWGPLPSSSVRPGKGVETDIPGLDPYLRWAEHTRWRGMTGQAGWDREPPIDDRVQIIARADDLPSRERLFGKEFADLLDIPPTYKENVPGSNQPALHFTAWVKHANIPRLRTTKLPAVWELSQPRRDAERVASGSAMGKFGPLRSQIDFTARNLLQQCIADADALTAAGKLDNVIAVIDFGCPFLNTRFAPAARVSATRVARLWDQGSAVPRPGDSRGGPGWPWTEPATLRYGREIHPNRLQAMAQRIHEAPEPGSPAIDEAAAYRGIDYLIDYGDPRRRVYYATHGSHVFDVAGGLLDPLTGRQDEASEAALVFVQLPSMTAADSSGASLASHLLDGVRYVLDQCNDGARVVVNISYGSFAGPHNGRSLIETALDELLRLRGDNFAIVLAAGNGRQKRCHAGRQVRKDRSVLLRVELAEGDTTDTFVEAWYPMALPPGWALKARVRGPSREWSPSLGIDREVLQTDPASGDDVVAMLRHESMPPNGCDANSRQPDLALVLLALAPTAQPASVPCALADAGAWDIELMLEKVDKESPHAAPVVDVKAWIERDDPGQNAGAAPHSFADQDADDDLNTLSSLATGELTVLAGGFRRSDRRPAEYSSTGPQRHGKSRVPMVLAVCEEDAEQPDIAAAAVRSGETWRMNGTSVAAPVLSRRLYNTMARWAEEGRTVRRGDWRKILEALTQEDEAVVRLP